MCYRPDSPLPTPPHQTFESHSVRKEDGPEGRARIGILILILSLGWAGCWLKRTVIRLNPILRSYIYARTCV